MWANRNPATEDLNRIVANRSHKTAVRNQIAAHRGSPYVPHEQDRLKREVTATAGAWERLTGPDIGEWKRGGLFGMFGSLNGDDEFVYEDRLDKYDGLEEGQTGHLELLQKLITTRKAMMAEYANTLNKSQREQVVIDAKETSAHKRLGIFLTYGGDHVEGFTSDYDELLATYQRDAIEIATAKNNLNALEEQLQQQGQAIIKQDNAIREQAIVAGVDVGGLKLMSGTADYVKGGVPWLLLGAISAIGASMLLANTRPTAFSKGRRGSAYNVFMGK